MYHDPCPILILWFFFLGGGAEGVRFLLRKGERVILYIKSRLPQRPWQFAYATFLNFRFSSPCQFCVAAPFFVVVVDVIFFNIGFPFCQHYLFFLACLASFLVKFFSFFRVSFAFFFKLVFSPFPASLAFFFATSDQPCFASLAFFAS